MFCLAIDLLNTRELKNYPTSPEYYLASILQEAEKLACNPLYSIYQAFTYIKILKKRFNINLYYFILDCLDEYVNKSESSPLVLKYLIIVLKLYPEKFVLKFLDKLVEYFDRLSYKYRKFVISYCFEYLSEYKKEFINKLLNNSKLGLSSFLDKIHDSYNMEDFRKFVECLDISEKDKRVIEFIYMTRGDLFTVEGLSINYRVNKGEFKITLSFKDVELRNKILNIGIEILRNISRIPLENKTKKLKDTGILNIVLNDFKDLVFDIKKEKKGFNLLLNNKPLFTGDLKIDEEISKLFEKIIDYMCNKEQEKIPVSV